MTPGKSVARCVASTVSMSHWSCRLHGIIPHLCGAHLQPLGREQHSACAAARLPPHPAPDACCPRTLLLSWFVSTDATPSMAQVTFQQEVMATLKLQPGDGPQKSSGSEGHVIFRKTNRHLVGRSSALPGDRSMRTTGSPLGSPALP